MRAPYYIWIGRVPQLSTILAEPKTEAPSGFPATFLYTMSWEDPRPDMQVTYCAPTSQSLMRMHFNATSGSVTVLYQSPALQSIPILGVQHCYKLTCCCPGNGLVNYEIQLKHGPDSEAVIPGSI